MKKPDLKVGNIQKTGGAESVIVEVDSKLKKT